MNTNKSIKFFLLGAFALATLASAYSFQFSKDPAADFSKAYRLSVGDKIDMAMPGVPDLTVTDDPILPDGTLAVPLLDPVPAAGKTVAELIEMLTTRYRQFLKKPRLSIHVSYFQTPQVIVGGYVGKPGQVVYTTGLTALSAIASAGGGTIDGDLAHVTIVRPGQPPVTVDLSHPETKMGTPKDVALMPQDFIIVPQFAQVMVGGLVEKTGPVDILPGMRVLGAIAAAGGQKVGSDLSHVGLLRPGSFSIILDLSHPEQKMGSTDDVLLRAQDQIVVPELGEVTVVGLVTNPGVVAFKTDMRVMDALGGVLGVKDAADLEGATIIRDGKTIPVDLNKLLRLGQADQNVRLYPGDTLQVPETQKKVFVFGAVTKAGFYYPKSTDRILDALNAAGGIVPTGDDARIQFIKVDSSLHMTSRTVVKLHDLYRKGDISQNLPVSGGYVIFVPYIHTGLTLSDLPSFISAFFYGFQRHL